MTTFPSYPSITSRIAQGTELSYAQMDTNFGNLTQSVVEVINLSKTASYVDSSNTFIDGTSQSFDHVNMSSSTVNHFTASKIIVNTSLLLETGSTLIGGTIYSDLVGTSSYSTYAIVASTSSISDSASLATSASYAKTSSWAVNSVYSDFVVSSSYALSTPTATTASYALTATSALNALTATTASYALNASTATSASYALNAAYVKVIASQSFMPSGQLYYIMSGSTKVVCLA